METAREYQQMYMEYSNKIYRYFRCRVPNDWDAEDLTSTVFLKVYSKRAQYDGRYPFGAWIYRIAHNTLIDFLRKKTGTAHRDRWF
ncbi:RNA polymerase sigma factor [Brevibacillus humidisoli]|uniref:RNA polymerase sigma factor n=1 Tax=Brevibacillus humidisoli TaxID=2895522 RepID=UPI002102D645|nr:sigma-70 family RNA polymerase sigma factor [Brevibacillus humidisoli]